VPKSLSPAGKKLTPMFAISVQGLLFSLAQLLGGVSLLGHILGVWLISLWSMSQPILLGWVLNGDPFIQALLLAIRSFSPNYGYALLLGYIALILSMGLVLVILSRRLSQDRWDRYQDRLSQVSGNNKRLRKIPFPLVGLGSVLVTYAFLFYTESAHARSIWIWIRPLAILILFWLLVRVVPLDGLITQLKRAWPTLGETVEAAKNKILKI